MDILFSQVPLNLLIKIYIYFKVLCCTLKHLSSVVWFILFFSLTSYRISSNTLWSLVLVNTFGEKNSLIFYSKGGQREEEWSKREKHFSCSSAQVLINIQQLPDYSEDSGNLFRTHRSEMEYKKRNRILQSSKFDYPQILSSIIKSS